MSPTGSVSAVQLNESQPYVKRTPTERSAVCLGVRCFYIWMWWVLSVWNEMMSCHIAWSLCQGHSLVVVVADHAHLLSSILRNISLPKTTINSRAQNRIRFYNDLFNLMLLHVLFKTHYSSECALVANYLKEFTLAVLVTNVPTRWVFSLKNSTNLFLLPICCNCRTPVSLYLNLPRCNNE